MTAAHLLESRGAAGTRAFGPRKSRDRGRFTGRQLLCLFFVPSLLLIGMFSYYPAIRSLIGGFYQWNGFSPPTYVGAQNFRTYFTSPQFSSELRNLGLLVFGSLLITLVAQFTAAEVVLRLPTRLRSTIKYVLVLPMVMPPLIVIDVWAYLLAPGSGLIDETFRIFGLPQLQWLSSEHLALLSILLVGFPWISNLGFLIFLGGLQHLPHDVREAAQVDGSSTLRSIFSVDIPLLIPQFRVVTILAGIAAAQNFIPILLLTNGGPGNATIVPGLDMYESAFQGDDYGYGMAIGTLMFAAMLIFTVVTLRALRPRT